MGAFERNHIRKKTFGRVPVLVSRRESSTLGLCYFSHVTVSWETAKINRTNIDDELLVFYPGDVPPNDCHLLIHHSNPQSRRRARREGSPQSSAAVEPSCRLHRWYLDFERLGWTQWIRYPTGFYANYCSGACSVTPSGATDNTTTVSNHAFVRSLYQAASNGTDQDGPPSGSCCVSLRLSPINILYNNDDGQWLLTEMAEMAAEACGCL